MPNRRITAIRLSKPDEKMVPPEGHVQPRPRGRLLHRCRTSLYSETAKASAGKESE